MKIAILGAGAMGCLFGAHLSKAHEVTLFDVSEKQIDAINQNGVQIEANGETTVYRDLCAAKNGTAIGAVDLVILFVKGMYTLDALDANRALLGGDTLVLTMQNGAGNDRDIMKFVDAARVVVGTTTNNAVNLGAGRVRHTGFGSSTIGSNSHAMDKVKKIADAFRACGLSVTESDDIQRIIWSKLFVNLSINTFTALMEAPIGYMYENKYAWDFARRIIYEAIEVAEADGTYFDRREVMNHVRDVCIAAKDGYSSMYQDRRHHVKTEIDRINGAIVEQAKLYGVPTPYNAMMVDLIHAVEGTYAFVKD